MVAATVMALVPAPALGQFPGLDPAFEGVLPPIDATALSDGMPMRGAPGAALARLRPSAVLAALPAPRPERIAYDALSQEPELEPEPEPEKKPEPEGPPQRLRDVDFSKLGLSDFLPALPGGGFDGTLSLAASTTYDDNIFARDEDQEETESDFIFSTRPGVELRSDWANHAVAVEAELRDRRHVSNSSEDSTGFLAAAEGRLDIRRNSRVEARVRRLREHQSRSDNEDRGGLEPTPIDRFAVEAQGEQAFGRLELSFRGSYESFDFANVPAPGGGVIRNNDRDRIETDFGGRATLRMASDLSIYIEANTGERDFERPSADLGFDRSSRVYEFILGGEFQMRGFRKGETYLGVRRQKFDDPLVSPVSGLVTGLHLEADLTPLTTLEIDSSRALEVTTIPSAASVFATQFDLRLEHAATPDLTFGLALHALREEFVNVEREDITLGLGLDSAYALGRNAALVFAYDLTARDSTLGTDFRRNQATLGLEVHY